MFHPQLMQYVCMQVMNFDRIFQRVFADFISFAVDMVWYESTPSQPYAKAVAMVAAVLECPNISLFQYSKQTLRQIFMLTRHGKSRQRDRSATKQEF